MPEPRLHRCLALAGLLLASAAGSALAQGPPAGWARCVSCHSPAAGSAGSAGAAVPDGPAGARDPAAVGPPLLGLAGRRAGSLAGYRYSGPLARSGLVWEAATLSDFLRDPQARVPGNRMAFSGIDDAAELQALVAWLLATPSSPHPAERTAP